MPATPRFWARNAIRRSAAGPGRAFGRRRCRLLQQSSRRTSQGWAEIRNQYGALVRARLVRGARGIVACRRAGAWRLGVAAVHGAELVAARISVWRGGDDARASVARGAMRRGDA